MKNYFSRLGRSFIPAVAVMSFFSIVLSVGAALRNPFIVEKIPLLGTTVISDIALILNKMGLVIIDNMAFVFAVSIAFGMTKDRNKKHVAAFSAMIGYLFLLTFSQLSLDMFHLVISPEVSVGDNGMAAISRTMEMKEAMQSYVLGFHVVDMSVVGGIIVGALSGMFTDRYSEVSLPIAFSFYQGNNLPPILTAVACAMIGLLTPFVWPIFGGMIYGAASIVAGMGVIGSFIFGFIERLLIITGLHHVWYSVVHYTAVGGTADICGQTYEGTKAITTAALSCPDFSENLSDITRLWLGQGALPIKLFGIPGALLAIYHTSTNKDRAKAVCIAAAGASIFAGVTEPFEFLFIFLAPPLFLIHAALSGLSFAILDVLNASFLGGTTIFDFFFNGVFQGYKSTWIPELIVGLVMFCAYYGLFKWYIIKFDLQTPGREKFTDEIDEEYEIAAAKMLSQKSDKAEVAAYILENLGGKENIVDFSNCISRLRIEVKDGSLINMEKIDKTPDSLGCVKASDNQVQIIFGMKVGEYTNKFGEVMDNA